LGVYKHLRSEFVWALLVRKHLMGIKRRYQCIDCSLTINNFNTSIILSIPSVVRLGPNFPFFLQNSIALDISDVDIHFPVKYI
jgi:hypothetical protein